MTIWSVLFPYAVFLPLHSINPFVPNYPVSRFLSLSKCKKHLCSVKTLIMLPSFFFSLNALLVIRFFVLLLKKILEQWKKYYEIGTYTLKTSQFFSLFQLSSSDNVLSHPVCTAGSMIHFVPGESRFKKFVNWNVWKLKSWKNQFGCRVQSYLHLHKKVRKKPNSLDDKLWWKFSPHDWIPLRDLSHLSISKKWFFSLISALRRKIGIF